MAQVTVVGGVERELTVELRPKALQAAGVGVAQVVGALQAQNLSAPVGRLLGALDERTIRLRGRLASRRRISSGWSSRRRTGRLVRLGDVAVVRDGTAEARSAAVFDGAEAVGIEIVKSKGSSTTTVAASIRDGGRPPEGALPPDTSFRIVRDAGDRVARSVGDVEYALDRGRGPDRARGVPVPELLAVDDHHRHRAADLGARVVRGGAGRSASR